MNLKLTEVEYLVLLGLLEDILHQDILYDVLPDKYRKAVKSIIEKLGGTYFGNCERLV